MALSAPALGELALRQAWSSHEPTRVEAADMPVIGEVLTNGAVRRFAAPLTAPAPVSFGANGEAFALKSGNGYELFQPTALSKLRPGDRCLIHLNDREMSIVGRMLFNDLGILGIEPLGQSWLLEIAATRIESVARHLTSHAGE